jgi:alkylation response protein AidB-like acyl-CoA dehydrogenase
MRFPRRIGLGRLCDGLRAEDKGDHFLLNGRKLWITNAAEAGFFLLFANANPEAGYKGVTAFLIERDFPGFQVGKKEDKIGLRASTTCELILDNCRVARENVMGYVGKGYRIAIETLNEGRIGIGAQMLGLAEGALEHAVRYTKERKQFGHVIADFQGVQFQLARAATDVEAARLLVYNAARLRDDVACRSGEAAMAKYFSSEIAERWRRNPSKFTVGSVSRRTIPWKSCIAAPRSGGSTKGRAIFNC